MQLRFPDKYNHKQGMQRDGIARTTERPPGLNEQAVAHAATERFRGAAQTVNAEGEGEAAVLGCAGHIRPLPMRHLQPHRTMPHNVHIIPLSVLNVKGLMTAARSNAAATAAALEEGGCMMASDDGVLQHSSSLMWRLAMLDAGNGIPIACPSTRGGGTMRCCSCLPTQAACIFEQAAWSELHNLLH
ncbi:hypothetical protein MMC29_003623 [Sticta canariensis]|nr:hypothetical protein [Sticta canariensis]